MKTCQRRKIGSLVSLDRQLTEGSRTITQGCTGGDLTLGLFMYIFLSPLYYNEAVPALPDTSSVPSMHTFYTITQHSSAPHDLTF